MTTEPQNNNSEPQSLVTEQTTQGTEPEKKEGVEPEKKEEPPKQEEKKAEAYVPLKAEDLKFPEGMEVDAPMRDSFLEIVNKHSIPKEAVEALVALNAEQAKAGSERGTTQWNEMQDKWRMETLAAPEFAGEKKGPAFAEIGKLIDEYGSPELRAALDLTGAGNNVHVARFFHKIASALGEGRPLSGQPGGGATTDEQKLAQMYPTMAQKG